MKAAMMIKSMGSEVESYEQGNFIMGLKELGVKGRCQQGRWSVFG